MTPRKPAPTQTGRSTSRYRLLVRVPAVVVTLGADGAVYRDRTGARHHAPGWSVEVVDTTGAGDTIAGYLAACLADDVDVATALARANAAAALCVQRSGAVPAVPLRQEVDALIAMTRLPSLRTEDGRS